MRWIYKMPLRLRSLFRKKRSEQELSEEFRFHLDKLIEESLASGMSAEDARYAALREFGGVEQLKEECRDSWGVRIVSELGQDVRYGFRQLRRNPGFTAVAILTLALGIGANTAIFGAVSGILLQPLPFPHARRLVGIEHGSFPRGGYAAMRQQVHTLDVAAYSDNHQFNLTGRGAPVRLEGALVSANLFRVLDVQAAMGTTFSTGQDVSGQDRYVILSYALWQGRFGADPSIVGQAIQLEGVARQVVGVMPATFRFPSPSTEVWVPLGIDPRDQTSYWASDYMPVIGRLKPNVAQAQATAEIRLFQSRLRGMFPWPMPESWNAGLAVVPLDRVLVGDLRFRLTILLGAVLLILLIASANVTSLTLARASVREREISLRAALGASRHRIVRQFVTESLVMSCVGGAVGVALAAGALPLVRSLLPPGTPGLANVGIDWRVVLFTAALAIFSGLVSGVAPGLQCARVAPSESMKSGGRSVASSGNRRARKVLVAGEIALAVLLVSGAGLLIQSLWRLAHVDPGFRPERLLALRVTPDESFCNDTARCASFYRELVSQAAALPGVRGAAVVNTLPLDGRVTKRSIVLEGKQDPNGNLPLVWENIVSPGYFRVMGIPILKGRAFANGDGMGNPPVAVLSASTAQHFWPGESPIGRHIRLSETSDWYTVVGVAPDVRAFSLAQSVPDWINGTIYLPYGPKATQENREMPAGMTLAVRGPADTPGLVQSLRTIVSALNGETPVSKVRTMSALISESTSSTRSIAWLFAVFAGIALALGAVGIYGVVAFFVGQRTREFGIRMALGAQRRDVMAAVLYEGLALAVSGVAIGLLAALALTRFLGRLLYGVSATDPFTLGGVAAIFAFVVILACYIPARRAAKVDPMVALRYE